MISKIKVNLSKLEMMIDNNNSIESIQKKVATLKRQLIKVGEGGYNPICVGPLMERFNKAAKSI